MRINTIFTVIAAIFISMFTIGCLYSVEPGEVGRIMTPSGFQDEILRPGRHWVGPASDLITLETSDRAFTVPMNVLCTDQLTITFEVAGLSAVRTATAEDLNRVSEIFVNLRPDATLGSTDINISAQQMNAMYVTPVVAELARQIVSQYSVSDVAANSARISGEIATAIQSHFEGEFVEVKRITIQNLQFPAVITEAQQARARRQIEIETEQASQAIRLMEANNQLEIASIEYQEEMIRSSMVADSNRLIGDSITPGFLAYHQIVVFGEAANGPNNAMFIPYMDYANSDNMSFDVGESAVDAALLERVRAAREMGEGSGN